MSTSIGAAPAERAAQTSGTDEPRPLPLPVVAAFAVAGLLLRIAVLAGPIGRPGSDEVLSALMTRHIGTDGFPVFLWGQHYGGTLELIPVTISLRLFGWSTLSLRLPGLVLGVVISVLVWRLARRLLGEPRARVAGLLIWVYPGTAIWFGLREQLFYPLTVVLGLGLLLEAVRIGEQRRLADWLAAGLLAGVAFWTSPFFLYFAVPAGVVVIVGLWRPGRPRRLLPGLALAVGGAVLGAAPWLGANLGHDWPSLHAGDTFPTSGSYAQRFLAFFTDTLPGMLGLRRVGTLEWIGGPLGIAVYAGLLVLLAVGLVRGVRAWRATGVVAWDVLGLVVFPFVFATFRFVIADPNFRYALFAVPFAIVVASRVISVRPGRAAGVLVAATVLSALTLQQIYVVIEVERGAGIEAVDLAPTLRVLDEHHVDAVYADYWVAYRIDYETEERIVGVPSSGIDRYAPYDELARQASHPAWVVSPGSQQDALLADLATAHVGAEVIPAGDLTVVIPATPVRPEAVSPTARSGPQDS